MFHLSKFGDKYRHTTKNTVQQWFSQNFICIFLARNPCYTFYRWNYCNINPVFQAFWQKSADLGNGLYCNTGLMCSWATMTRKHVEICKFDSITLNTNMCYGKAPVDANNPFTSMKVYDNLYYLNICQRQLLLHYFLLILPWTEKAFQNTIR